MHTSILAYQSVLRCAVGLHQPHRNAIASPIRVQRAEVGDCRKRSHRLAVALDETAASTSGRDSDDDLENLNAQYITHLQQEYSIDDLVTFSSGPSGMPMVTLRHPDGTKVDICLHGAIISSWQRSDGKEMLYMRPETASNSNARVGTGASSSSPMRGGIEVAWPQYGAGVLPTHGLLKSLHWSVVETAATEDPSDPRPTVCLYACSESSTEEVWPHAFEIVYSVSLQAEAPKTPNPKELALEMDQAHAKIWEDALMKQMPASKLKELREGGKAVEELKAAAGESSTKNGGVADKGRHQGNTWGIQDQSDVGIADGGNDGNWEERATTPSTVLRLNLHVHNAGDQEMAFSSGIRQHYATEDLENNRKYVKMLGLGGKYVLDYSKDAMRPRMGVEGEDLLFFGDKDIARVYVDAASKGQVMLCPGTQTHFLYRNYEGFSDIAVEHPGLSAPQEARHHVIVTAARKACPVKLAPGETWAADVAVTQHDRYWELPLFEKEDPSTVPLPPREEALPPRRRSGMGEDILFEPDSA